MMKDEIVQNIIRKAPSIVRQAATWGGGGYLAHKSSQVADNHHRKDLEKRNLISKQEITKSKLANRNSKHKAIGTTIAGALAGSIGAIV